MAPPSDRLTSFRACPLPDWTNWVGAVATVARGASVQMAEILDLFDQSVDAGTLVGNGPGNSAAGRLRALRNMLWAAGGLIDDDRSAGACHQLQDAVDRTDGEPRPPDFAKGPAASVLASRISALMDRLECR